MKNWRYYNHAAVPTTAPHEEVDLTPIRDGSIWKMDGNPLFARWTTDFDCGYETNWWYCIKKAPYDYEALSRKARKHIRQSLNKCTVRLVNAAEYSQQLWDVYRLAFERYEGTSLSTTEASFKRGLQESKLDWWAAFGADGRIIGWINCRVYPDWVSTVSAKFDPEHLAEGASAALYHSLLTEYLNVQCKKYVDGGERTVNHRTNTQDYKIDKFQYTRAYCRLHIAFNPKIKWIIKCAYPFRKPLRKLDGIGLMHQLNAVLKMEEIVRN